MDGGLANMINSVPVIGPPVANALREITGVGEEEPFANWSGGLSNNHILLMIILILLFMYRKEIMTMVK